MSSRDRGDRDRDRGRDRDRDRSRNGRGDRDFRDSGRMPKRRGIEPSSYYRTPSHDESPTKRKKLVSPDQRSSTSTAGNRGEERNSSGTSRTKVSSPPTPPLPDIFESEEKLIDINDAGADLTKNTELCSNFRQLLAELSDPNKTAEDRTKLATERKSTACAMLMGIRQLNRRMQMRVGKIRSSTSDMKLAMDARHLLLQNQLYEVQHLQKQIRQCLEFYNAAQDVPLISIEEFRQLVSEAPEDEHELMKARLNLELQQRIELRSKRESIEKRRAELLEKVKKRTAELRSIGPQLERLMRSAEPLQKLFSFDVTEQVRLVDSARYLCPPLHTLISQLMVWMQCDAASSSTARPGDWHTAHPWLTLTIQGSIDEAKAFDSAAAAAVSPLDLLSAVAQEDDTEDKADADEDEKRRKKKRKSARSVNDAAAAAERRDRSAKEQACAVHPLAVVAVIKCDDSTNCTLQFQYSFSLRLVFVKCSIDKASGQLAKWLDDSLLRGLLNSDDLGLCFNGKPASCGAVYSTALMDYLTCKGMTDTKFLLDRLGQPFLWCQQLGGHVPFIYQPSRSLNGFDSADSDSGTTDTDQFPTSGKVVESLKERLTCRCALDTIINCLERGQLPSLAAGVAAEDRPPPGRLSNSLGRWQSVGWEGYSADELTAGFVDGRLVGAESHYFYRMELKDKKVILEALIAVPVDYPRRRPIFGLQLTIDGQKRSASNCINVEAMEEEINVHCGSSSTVDGQHQLLLVQINWLQALFDHYLALEQNAAGSSGRPNVSTGVRLSRGPLRVGPFRYDHQMGLFTFR